MEQIIAVPTDYICDMLLEQKGITYGKATIIKVGETVYGDRIYRVIYREELWCLAVPLFLFLCSSLCLCVYSLLMCGLSWSAVHVCELWLHIHLYCLAVRCAPIVQLFVLVCVLIINVWAVMVSRACL
jgi:hypothetical protein